MNDVPATAPDADRRAVDDLVRNLPGGRPGEMSFDHPWEIRAFALAVAAHTAGEFDWPVFQGALIDAIKDGESFRSVSSDESWSYYEHWLRALEAVMASNGAIDRSALTTRAAEVLAAPPNRNHHKAILEPVAIDAAITATPS
ncbi:nitrile hydratase accessory protein [Williamsia muralis]|uniref:Nitrile hydratase accessory protein n=1 Tax=Williamsia marianensis TaxID=85044 RepID=A0A2G3PLN3_WILMA|nr:nitrile hydratase accessory protein [Williamsia marianensis]PHV66739.1 nitrile hydratase accessory protein [Williamsia marianensis]